MNELVQALDDVRRKMRRYQGKELNEQNTKTALIHPVLRALGWDVGDLEEVQQEYKRRPRDKPVDYALLLLRAPRLFVEAKALGQNLNERRWAHQIMGYATVAGVEWVVLTNGDEYRIYNACAAVPVEEKLFRTVQLTDADSPAEETLALLSKEQISENQIEVLWQAQFVDRQVRSALDKLFAAEPDPSLVRLVKRGVKELSTKDVRASLARLQVRFDFPVELEPPATGRQKAEKPARSRTAKSGKKGGFPDTTRRFLDLGYKMREVAALLVRERFLSAPLELTAEYRGRTLKAQLEPDGNVVFKGKRYTSPSGAARDAKGTVTGRPMSEDGWRFWHYRDQTGQLVPLDVARQEFLKQKAN
ncbi:MAG: restriction system modified-DNA reader domain-containing protein [Planctomycetota bacterium]|jgi:hypothetical protein